MNKLIICVLMALGFSAQAHSDLYDAIKALDIQRVKLILEDKASHINKAQLQEYLSELKTKVETATLGREVNLPWYERYGSLAKIGLGLLGLSLCAGFAYRAMKQNPANHASSSFKASGYLVCGLIAGLSVSSVALGVHELTEYRKTIKIYTIRELVKQAIDKAA